MTHKIELVLPELSYKVVGVAYNVNNTLGPGFKEKHLQRAMAEGFRLAGLRFREQAPVVLKYGDKIIGRYYLDFVVEDCLVVEIKQGDYFAHTNIKQAQDYLKSLNLQLALLINFTQKGVRTKRIVNIYPSNKAPKQD